MGSRDPNTFEDDGGGGGKSSDASLIQCSICFEVVSDNGERSRAKLSCGHEFHLDCIGSAFNSKGTMQCPNCRKVEKGQWLFSNGYRSCTEFNVEDYAQDEELYDLSYTEVSFGVQWCPFSGLTRVPSSFEGGDSPPNTYHGLLGHQAIFGDHASSVAHSCPYFPYFNQFHSSSNSTVDLRYPSWDHHSPPSLSPISSLVNTAGQALVPSASVRSSRGAPEGQSRSSSFVHPVLLGYGSGSRAGSSVLASMVPPYPSSNSRAYERMIQGVHAYHQQQRPNSTGVRAPVAPRRSSDQRSLAAPVGQVVSSSDHTNGYFLYPQTGASSGHIQETENPQQTRFYAWERDRFPPFPLIPVERESSWRGPLNQSSSGSESGSITTSHWHGYGSGRISSQSRPDNSHYQQVHHPSGRVLHPFI